jgi:hypothetical protein
MSSKLAVVSQNHGAVDGGQEARAIIAFLNGTKSWRLVSTGR